MVDIEALLQPISAANPVGLNLLSVPADDTFRRLEELATEYDAATSPSGQAKESDWSGVVRLASAALQSKSKDLNLVAALTQGLARTDGFAGLRDGLLLARGMLDKYWKKAHPGHGDDGTLHYSVHFKGLSVIGSGREFLTAVQKIPIVPRPGRAPLGWYEYVMARRTPGGVDEASRLAARARYEEYVAQGFVTSADWLAGLAAVSQDELRALLANLSSGRDALKALIEFFQERTQKQPPKEGVPPDENLIPSEAVPNFLPLRDLLDSIAEVVEKAAGAIVTGDGTSAVDNPVDGAAALDSARGVGGGGNSRGLTSRVDALRQLDEVAEFLHRTDPHSPVAFLVKRAVRWGNMPLDAVLAEVLENDEGSLKRVREALGLQGNEPGGP